jgi:hypothetical protein
MLMLDNNSVTLNVKSIVLDSDTGYGYRRPQTLYWATCIGSRVALQGVFASLVSKSSVFLKVDSEDRKKTPQLRYSDRLTVPEDGRMHAMYKKLQSGLSAVVMYSSLVKADGGENRYGSAVLLCKESEDQKTALYHFLRERLRVPLHETWKAKGLMGVVLWRLVCPISSNLSRVLKEKQRGGNDGTVGD